MIRIILAVVALVGALIALLVYISSPASDRLDTQNELIKSGGKGIGSARNPNDKVRIPADRPRAAAHVLMEIEYPIRDPRAKLGGGTLLTLHGNGVAYRRKSLDAATFERHRVAVADVDTALEQAFALSTVSDCLPDGVGEFRCILDVGKGRQNRFTSEKQVVALLERLRGRSSAWVPDAIAIRLQEARGVQPSDAPLWPTISRLGAPATYATEAGEVFRAPKPAMRAVLTAIESSDRFLHDGSTFRLVSWEAVMK